MLEGVSQQAGAGPAAAVALEPPGPGEPRGVGGARGRVGSAATSSGLAVNRPAYLRRARRHRLRREPARGVLRGDAVPPSRPGVPPRSSRPAGRAATRSRRSGAVSPNEDAVMVVLQLADASSAQAGGPDSSSRRRACRRAASGGGRLAASPPSPTRSRRRREQAALRGLVACVEYRERVFQILGYTSDQRWPTYEEAFARGDRELRARNRSRRAERAAAPVEPRRLDRAETLDALKREYPSTVPAQTIGLINDLPGNARCRPARPSSASSAASSADSVLLRPPGIYVYATMTMVI